MELRFGTSLVAIVGTGEQVPNALYTSFSACFVPVVRLIFDVSSFTWMNYLVNCRIVLPSAAVMVSSPPLPVQYRQRRPKEGSELQEYSSGCSA